MKRVAVGLLVVAVAGGCSASSTTATGGPIEVVVAESSWGSIAAQLGGEHVHVTDLITSPDVDPHDYEPTTADGRAIASARYVVFNGLGYDNWVGRAVDANPSSARLVLDIGQRLGLSDVANPHRWYFPGDVSMVIEQITSDYKKLDPANASYFDERRHSFETEGLRRYDQLLDEMRRQYSGTPVGASESIFAGLANATGLDLRTPPGFLAAISEGTDPTAQDKVMVDQQINGRQIEVFVYNGQNATPDVQVLVDAAHTNDIEVVTITETPPAEVPFQDWQADQLQRLLDALARAARP